MLHIPLLITFNALLLMQQLHSMEKESESKSKFSLILRKKSADSPRQPHYIPHHDNTETSAPSIVLTTSSESTSTSRSQSSSSKKLVRGKTADNTTSTPKESPFKIFSKSDDLTSSSSPKISPRSILTSSMKSLSQEKTAPQKKINLLTNAVKNYDFPTIEEYINNPEANLNQMDQYGNTALHYAVGKMTEKFNNEDMLKKIITLFLKDLRTDSSITREIDKRRASDMLSGGENPEMRTLLFARATLDIRTNHEIGKMLLENYLNNIPLTDDHIKQTVECITKKIRSTETEVGKNSIDLPQDATLPDYATDGFIFNMIKHRLPDEVYTASELQKTILKDIFVEQKNVILLNVTIDINEKSISESLDNIMNAIKKSHNYLTKFMTKPCIFEILETYYLNKEKNSSSHLLNFYSEKNTIEQAPSNDISECKKSKKPSDFLQLYATNNTNEKTLSIREFISKDCNRI